MSTGQVREDAIDRLAGNAAIDGIGADVFCAGERLPGWLERAAAPSGGPLEGSESRPSGLGVPGPTGGVQR
eukprot:6222586-Prymnesium_polylepis.1